MATKSTTWSASWSWTTSIDTGYHRTMKASATWSWTVAADAVRPRVTSAAWDWGVWCRAQPDTFRPDDVASIAAWYRARDLGVSTGTSISQWDETEQRSARRLEQTSSRRQPVFQVDTTNHLPYLAWRSPDMMETSSRHSLSGSGRTLITLIRPRGTSQVSPVGVWEGTSKTLIMAYTHDDAANTLQLKIEASGAYAFFEVPYRRLDLKNNPDQLPGQSSQTPPWVAIAWMAGDTPSDSQVWYEGSIYQPTVASSGSWSLPDPARFRMGVSREQPPQPHFDLAGVAWYEDALRGLEAGRIGRYLHRAHDAPEVRATVDWTWTSQQDVRRTFTSMSPSMSLSWDVTTRVQPDDWPEVQWWSSSRWELPSESQYVTHWDERSEDGIDGWSAPTDTDHQPHWDLEGITTRLSHLKPALVFESDRPRWMTTAPDTLLSPDTPFQLHLVCHCDSSGERILWTMGEDGGFDRDSPSHVWSARLVSDPDRDKDDLVVEANDDMFARQKRVYQGVWDRTKLNVLTWDVYTSQKGDTALDHMEVYLNRQLLTADKQSNLSPPETVFDPERSSPAWIGTDGSYRIAFGEILVMQSSHKSSVRQTRRQRVWDWVDHYWDT